LEPGSPDFVAQIVKDVAPAVVRINASRVVENDPFGGFGPLSREIPSRERVQRGTGSGFIVSADGRIYTNAHVVEGADKVTVVLQDGRSFNGQVLGQDRTTDVAVVKIEAADLPTVKMGNSDALLPGQAAIAIGNPLGLDSTVTQGIISATGRSGADFGGSARVDFIQTDTAINPGNSGGPLLNSKGEVVGINTAIIQGANGIGFAVPILTAERVAEQLVAKGRAEHPYLGIQMAEITPELREQVNNSNSGLRIDQQEGVIVVAVQPNSPAATGGLRPGDVIESVEGTAVQRPEQVQRQVAATDIGSTLSMTVNRNGQSRSISVKPAPLPDQEPG
jgi:S1-C subfamily serine protease